MFESPHYSQVCLFLINTVLRFCVSNRSALFIHKQVASYERKKDFYNMIELAIRKKDYQPFIKSYQSKLEGKEKHKQSITFYATLEDAFKEFPQNRRQVCDIVYALFPTSPNLTKIRLEFVISL